MSVPGSATQRTVVTSVTRAALLIGGLTVLARVAGFGRVLTLARTVGPTCLGDTYQAVNAVPNIIFEIVAGGALASLVVPLLAGTVAAGDRSSVDRTSSALLSWVLLALVPVAVVLALMAHPLAGFLLQGKACGGDAVATGASMLRVFAPQIPLYGVGVVLTGILQAHQRFTGPALAPLVSSVVVIAAYLTFAAIAGHGADIGSLSTRAELVLSVGTTLGVVALTASMLVPLAAAGVRLRPRLGFDHGVGGSVRRLAAAGVATLVAQQVWVAVALRLGNGAGVPAGGYALFTYAQTVFLLPWGVLAVPIATSVYPVLAASHDSGDRSGYAGSVSGATQGVLWAGFAGAGFLVATADPVARVMVQGAPGLADSGTLSAAISAFAPGLIGYSIFALHSRALYARGNARAAAGTAVIGWLAVIVAGVILAASVDPVHRVVALALANSVGMTVLGIALVVVLGRFAGRAAMRGFGRTVLVAAISSVFAAAIGRAVAVSTAFRGVGGSVASAALAGASVALVLAALYLLLSGQTARAAVLSRVRRHG